VVLDPRGRFGNIPKDVLQSFASHRIALLDIPSGAGAGGLCLLSLLCELRRARLIPRLPLTVSILGGDISIEAQRLYREQLDGLRTVLSSYAINVELETRDWDAADLVSTNELCHAWEQKARHGNERFVLITNFSGAGDKMLDVFKEAFRHISVRAAGANATVLWIEPGDKGGEAFLRRAVKLIIAIFARRSVVNDAPPTCEFNWWHELHSREYSGRSAVFHYRRKE
jgi:hypothetical protein